MRSPKRLLLINPPPNANAVALLHFENLGLGYLAASVRRHLGATHTVYVWDCAIVDPQMRHIQQLLDTIRPDYVGLSLSSMNAHRGVTIAESIKQSNPNIKILIGGILATSLDEKNLSCFFPDAIIRGEGELLINHVLKTFDEDNEPGLITVSQDTALDVNNLAWTSRDMLPWQLRLHPQTSISASRGCPYRCSFCSIPQPGGKKEWRPRNIEDVVAEMEYINKRYKSSHFYFVDDNFVLNSKLSFERAERFALLLMEKLPDIRFGFMCRSAAIDKNLFTLLKKSGLSGVFLGIESFSQPVLDRYQKKETVEEHIRAIAILNELGITFNPGFIFFDPWTTAPEINSTIDVMNEISFPALQSINSKLTCYVGSDIEKSIPDHDANPSTMGITKYSFLNEKTREIFDACCKLFYEKLTTTEDYITYQKYHYSFVYLQPYFLNTNRESLFHNYFNGCQLQWTPGDSIVLQLLKDYTNGIVHIDENSMKAALASASPHWKQGNSIAERFFRFAKIFLIKYLSREEEDKARLISLAFTSPHEDINIDTIFYNFPDIKETNRVILAETMSFYKGSNANICFDILLHDKDDDVALASIKSAQRIFHAPIMKSIELYLSRHGQDVSPELQDEIQRAKTLFSLNYPEFILVHQQDRPGAKEYL